MDPHGEKPKKVELIYQLTKTVSRSLEPDSIFDQALDAVQVKRALILLLDEAGAPYLVAWRGLSPAFRDAVLHNASAAGFPWHAATESQRPLLIPDVRAENRLAPLHPTCVKEGIRALAAIPITIQGQSLGQLAICYELPHAFTEDEVQLAQHTAAQMGLAIELKRTKTALQERHEDLEARVEQRTALLKKQIARRRQAERALKRESAIVRLLQEIAVAANEARTVEEAFQFALQKICEYTGWPVGHVYFLAPENKEPISSTIWHCDDEDRFRHFRRIREESASQGGAYWLSRVMESHEPAWIMDVTPESEFLSQPNVRETGLAVGFAFPVLVGKEVVAIIEFFSASTAEPDEALLEMMVHIGTQLGRVVERSRSQAALRRSEQRYRTLAGNIPGSTVTLLDSELHLTLIEGGVTLLPSIEKEELEGKTIWQILPRSLRRQLEPHFHAALAGQPQVFEKTILDRTYLIHVHPVTSDSEQPVTLMAMAQDVTGQKRAEERLARTAQQLAALNQLGQTVSASLEPDVVFTRVLEMLRALLDAEGIFILLRDQDELVFTAVSDIGREKLVGARVPAHAGIAGEVLRTGCAQWHRNEDGLDTSDNPVQKLTHYTPRAVLAVPLRFQGELIGIIEVIHSRVDAFNGDDLRLAEAAANWTSIAIDNARKHESLQRRLHESQAVSAISRALIETLDLERVLQLIVETAQRIMQDAEAAAIHLLDEGEEVLNLAALAGLELKREEYNIAVGGSLAGRAIREGHIINVNPLEGNGRHPFSSLEAGFHASLVAPVRGRSGYLGAITVYGRSRRGFGSDDARVLSSLAMQAAMAIENARLFADQQHARRMAETLRAANIGLTQTLELDTVLEALLYYLKQLIDYDTANVMLLENETELRIQALRGYEPWIDPGVLRQQKLSLEAHPHLKTVFKTKESIIINDTYNYPGWVRNIQGVEHVRSWMGIPLIASGNIFGLYSVDHSEPNYFTAQHRSLAEALAAQASAAVQNARLFKQLSIGRERLRHLTQQVVSVQEEERQRVSRELHDDAGQALTALKISLGLIKNSLPAGFEAIRDNIQEAADLTDQTMERIRLLAQNLRPPALDTLGLHLALEGLCHDFARRTNLSINYQGVELPNLAGSPSISLYRFLQEALTNIAKHADATTIEVDLRDDSGIIRLSVVDNGRGFRVVDTLFSGDTVGGIGLIGMQERFELLGGRLEVASQPNHGTRVIAYVPYQEG